MKFKRARTSEQKSERIDQIVKAAIKQYDKLPYEKITLSSIAKDLSFSRENMYKYFKTKEEIFLRVIEYDFHKWVKETETIFINRLPLSKFAKKYSALVHKNKRLIELISILNSVIEKNVSVEHLTEFNISFLSDITAAYPVLKKQFPQFSDKQVEFLFLIMMHFLVGFYPYTVQTKIQEEAITKSGLPYQVPDFIETYSQFIVTTVNGINS